MKTNKPGLNTKEIKEILQELLQKEHLFAKYLIHQPNGKFKETLSAEFFNSDNPRMIVIELASFIKDKQL